MRLSGRIDKVETRLEAIQAKTDRDFVTLRHALPSDMKQCANRKRGDA